MTVFDYINLILSVYSVSYFSLFCFFLLILAKLLEEIPVVSVDRITNVSDFNSDSSGYGSALTSPSFENSLLSMNSPVNSEGFCENDENQLQENSLLIGQ